jgi:Rieske Fe-S protein
MDTRTDTSGRRRFLARIITTVHAAIAGTLGVLLGGAVVSPSLVRREPTWLPAASLGSLREDEPTPIVLRVVRQDGYTQIVERRTVFLLRTGGSGVTALDSTCTHLGCRVSWDAAAEELRCPCHGGVYDREGNVKAGPPPAPLVRLQTRVDGDQVLVRV